MHFAEAICNYCRGYMHFAEAIYKFAEAICSFCENIDQLSPVEAGARTGLGKKKASAKFSIDGAGPISAPLI